MGQSFRDALEVLENNGELVRIRKEVDPEFETAAVLWKYKRGPAVIFEKVKGYEIPLVGNLVNTRRKFALSIGIEEKEVFNETVRSIENPINPRIVATAPCQEVVHTENINLMRMMPIPRISEKDGGPYLSAAIFITKNPDTGIANVSLNRLHITGDATMGTNMSPTNTYEIMRRCWDSGRPLEVAAAIGNHPATLVASNMLVPLGYDEFEIAGALLRGPLNVVRGVKVDLPVPAEAEIVIEGEIRPGDLDSEGPFGEFHGMYAAKKLNPVIRVKAVTHRNKPMLQMIVGGDHPEHLIIGGMAREPTLFKAVRESVPSVRRVYMGEGGFCRLKAVIALKTRTEGEAKRAILAAFGNQVLLKTVVAVDDDVDLEDPIAVEQAITRHVRADKDVMVIPWVQSSPVVPLSENFTIAKLGIDATSSTDKAKGDLGRAFVPADVWHRVNESWDKYLK